tara:strand:+ start:151 stop:498 length:348 start_codon:yes stop_codon:yes gene_type:complete
VKTIPGLLQQLLERLELEAHHLLAATSHLGVSWQGVNGVLDRLGWLLSREARRQEEIDHGTILKVVGLPDGVAFHASLFEPGFLADRYLPTKGSLDAIGFLSITGFDFIFDRFTA